MKYILLVSALMFCLTADASGWIKRANYGGPARHRSTAFSIGQKGYLGLGHINSITNILFEDFWEYDPSSNSWTQKANFGGGLRYHAYGFSFNNKGYVGTGRDVTGGYENDTWEYDPTTNVWTEKANFPGTPRRGAIAFVVDTLAFVGTGQISGSYTNTFYAYAPASDTWYTAPTMPAPGRTSSVAFSIDGNGYVGTGNVGGGSTDFWQYHRATNTWIQKANVGTTIRQEATGFAVHGYGFIGTGDNYSSGTNYGDFWKYDPIANTWVQIEDFEGAKRRYLSSFVIGDRAYTGTGTNGTNFKDFWEFDFFLSEISREIEANEVIAYPNPANSVLKLDINGVSNNTLKKLKLTIFNLKGQIIATNADLASSIQIPVASWENGIYLYRLTYSDHIVKSGKIIVQH